MFWEQNYWNSPRGGVLSATDAILTISQSKPIKGLESLTASTWLVDLKCFSVPVGNLRLIRSSRDNKNWVLEHEWSTFPSLSCVSAPSSSRLGALTPFSSGLNALPFFDCSSLELLLRFTACFSLSSLFIRSIFCPVNFPVKNENYISLPTYTPFQTFRVTTKISTTQ